MSKKLLVVLAVGLALTLTGCNEATMNTPGGRAGAHERCVEAGGKWEETPNSWRCNS